MRVPGVMKLGRFLWRILPGEKIPKLPRMYASDYSSIDPESARIMARYGIRSPSGIKLAMKRHKVATVDELVALLEHHRARRRIRQKLLTMFSRFSTGTKAIPYQRDIRRLVGTKKPDDLILQQRLKRLRSD